MFVIDASFTPALCLADEGGPAVERVIERLEREAAVAPAHWPLEIGNALRSAECRGRLRALELPRLRGLLAGLPVEIVPVDLANCRGRRPRDREDVRPLRGDAAYLALAAFRGLPLATNDEQRLGACIRAGVELVA